MSRCTAMARVLEAASGATTVAVRAPVSGLGERRPQVLRRAWRMPLLAHALALVFLLIGLAALIGPGSSFTSDEGASILQAEAIAHGHWTVPDPLPRIDPRGLAYPIELSAHGTKGYAPLGKHLFYGVLLAGADEVAGVPGMLALSLLGTVVAALLAAALSRELGPGLERATFWTVGLASPLLFDGFLVVAHTLGAALAAASVLLVLRALRRGGWGTLAGLAACLALACLVRTEAVLWCGAMAVGVGVVAWTGRRSQATGTPKMEELEPPTLLSSALRRGAAVAVVALGAGFGAHELDTVLTNVALGAHQSVLGGTAGGHSLAGQLSALYTSWFQSGASIHDSANRWLVVVLLLGAIGAMLVRRGLARRRGVVLLAAAGVACVLIRVFLEPTSAVTGLAVAFPVLWVGLWCMDRALLTSVAARLAIVTCSAYSLAVVATQYTNGGGLQWGGRYFALALPAAVPLAVAALRRQGPRLAPAAGQAVVAGMVVVSAALGVTAVSTLRSAHQASASLTSTTAAVAKRVAQADPGEHAVVITTSQQIPRMLWPIFGQERWLLVPPGMLPAYGARLRRAGVERLVLVGDEAPIDLFLLAGSYRPVSTSMPSDARGWSAVALKAS